MDTKFLKFFKFINFKVFIMDKMYQIRYHKFASESTGVNNFLTQYFSAITVNTPFDIEDVIYISKEESNLYSDMELIVDTSD